MFNRVSSTASRRVISLSTAFKGLSLSSKARSEPARDQVIPTTATPTPYTPPENFKASITYHRGGKSPPKTPKTPSTAQRGTVCDGEVLVTRRTPCCPPSAVMRATEAFHDRLKAEMRGTLSSSKPPRDFLRKDTNVRNFQAWDVSGRIGSIEQEFAQIKSTIEKSDSEREFYREKEEMYKTRSA